MGAYGCGGHNRIKAQYEETRRIDIKHLQKIGLLKKGQEIRGQGNVNYKYSWSCGNESRGNVNVQYTGEDYLYIVYTLTDTETGNKESRKDVIRFDYVKTNYGQRAYFVCEGCGELTTALCFRWSCWKCRKCQRLNYGSSQSNSRDLIEKYYRKAKRIAKRLGHKESLSCDDYYIPKPKRMRHETYERLLELFRKYQYLREMAFLNIMTTRFNNLINGIFPHNDR